MLRTRFLLLFLLFFSVTLSSQEGNLKSCLSKTRLFVNLYNNRQFKQIYMQLDSALQSKTSEKEFMSFLEKSLYEPYGKIMGFEHLSQAKEYQSFFLLFTGIRLKMQIALNPVDRITYLQFLPYEDALIKNTDSLAYDNGLKNALDSVVHRLAMDFMKLPQTCALSIGILRKGQRTYYNYGETNLGSARLPDKESIYEAGSISKTFTGMLLAKALLDKRIKAEEDIRKYLPGKFPNLQYENKPIQVLHLANHSAGLPRLPSNLFVQSDFDSLNPYKNYSQKQLLDDLHSLTLSNPPGSKCAYSNYGMALLGLILEKIYNKPYSELLKEEITETLGMKNSGIFLTEEQNKKFLQGYSAEGLATKHWDLGVFAPAGGLKTSAEDMLNYLEYQVREPDSLSKVLHRTTYDVNEKLALTWLIRSGKYQGDLFWHNGATFGFSSFCGFIRESETALVILVNSSSSTDHMAIQLLKWLDKER